MQDDGTNITTPDILCLPAGMTIAMKECIEETSLRTGTRVLIYLLTDHLGSVVAVTEADGALVGEQRFMPFGQVRTDTGTVTQTDYGYTGQRNLDAQQNAYSLGLMDYHPRFYDPLLGRFTQADSIVQERGTHRRSTTGMRTD